MKIRDKRECYQENNGTVGSYDVVTNLSLLTVCIATIILLIYVNFKVINIVGFKDLVLVLMMIFLKLSLLSYAIFFGF